MDLENALRSLYKSKDDESISRLVTAFNREGVHSRDDLVTLSRDQLSRLKLAGPEERKLLDYIRREFPKPEFDVKIDMEESMDEINRQREAEIAELKRKQELLRIEGEKKKKELERLRAENKKKQAESRASRPKNTLYGDENSDDSDDSSSFHYSFDSQPRSEVELLRVSVKENSKLIKLKREMYIEDKKRSWMPYRNKYDDYGDIDDQPNVQPLVVNQISKNSSLVLDLLALIICWLIFEWVIFSCNIPSPYNHTLRAFVVAVFLVRACCFCVVGSESCANCVTVDGCRDTGFIESDSDEHFVFRCLWASLINCKMSKFEVVLNVDFFKSIVAYVVFWITFEIMANSLLGVLPRIFVGSLVCLFAVVKTALALNLVCGQRSRTADSEAPQTHDGTSSPTRTKKVEMYTTFEYYKSIFLVAVLWIVAELISGLNAAPKEVAVIFRVVSIFFIVTKFLGHVYLMKKGRFDCSLNKRKI